MIQPNLSAADERKLRDRYIVASVSGGKDSTATCLYLKELGLPFEAVFCDTGWEHAETYRYLREELPEHIGPIRWLRSTIQLSPELLTIAVRYEARLGHYSAMVRQILRDSFSSRLRKWCTRDLKVIPMARYLAGIKEAEPVNTVGIRAEESDARSKMTPWESPREDWDMQAETWRPILYWTMKDVIEVHRRHNVTPNRLYFRDQPRVGCWPCIFAGKESIRTIANADPERIAIIRDLEAEMTALIRSKRIAKGQDPGMDQTWFWKAVTINGKAKMLPMHVDHAVLWSRAGPGGVGVAPVTEADHGCMRWGMCEAIAPESGDEQGPVGATPSAGDGAEVGTVEPDEAAPAAVVADGDGDGCGWGPADDAAADPRVDGPLAGPDRALAPSLTDDKPGIIQGDGLIDGLDVTAAVETPSAAGEVPVDAGFDHGGRSCGADRVSRHAADVPKKQVERPVSASTGEQ